MHFATLLLVSIAVLAVQASILGTEERARWVSRTWRTTHRLAATQDVVLHVALKQRNVDRLKSLVASVSDPESQQYGEYLSVDELQHLIAPSDHAVRAVSEYFLSMGASRIETVLTRDFVRVAVPAAALEKALDIRLHAFEHRHSKRVLFRTLDAYRFPSDIAAHIDVVTGLHDFQTYPSERRQAKIARARQAAPTGDNSPFIQHVAGSSQRLDVELVPYCQNGQLTNNSQQPCADAPPAIRDFIVTAKPLHFPLEYFNVSQFQCISPNPSGPGILCHAIIYVPANVRVIVSAQSEYTDASSSNSYTYAVIHAPSPYNTPQAIAKLYEIPSGLRNHNTNNSQSVVSFEAEQQYFSESDLRTFFELMGLPQDEPIVHGNNNVSNAGGEATLDVQYIMSTGRGVTTTFWSVAGQFGNSGYILEWAMEISNTTDAPLITSISYGDTELGYYNFYGGWEYIQRMEVELAKMAARGMTVFAGSGDAGASNVGEDGNDLSPEDPTCTPLRPFYPSNSAYVVSTSATFMGLNHLPFCAATTTIGDPIVCETLGEVSVGLSQGTYWTTGGGFSNLTWNQRTAWQAPAVEYYLQNTPLPPSSIWNMNGRAYPDLSALGYQIPVVFGGEVWPIGGTSASGPIAAGLFALLNEHRLNNNLPPLGHVAPLLYSLVAKHPQTFNDIVMGDNVNGDLQFRGSTFPSFCPYGFFTASGWDPVSGIGTPNFSELRNHINAPFENKKENKK